jgi:hypothetical protein
MCSLKVIVMAVASTALEGVWLMSGKEGKQQGDGVRI